MLNRFELLRRRCADAEDRGVGGLEIRMLLFDASKFSKQRVVLRVGKRRLAQHVVLVVGTVEGLAQFGGAGRGVGGCQDGLR